MCNSNQEFPRLLASWEILHINRIQQQFLKTEGSHASRNWMFLSLIP